jgi:hypothetical protein
MARSTSPNLRQVWLKKAKKDIGMAGIVTLCKAHARACWGE